MPSPSSYSSSSLSSASRVGDAYYHEHGAGWYFSSNVGSVAAVTMTMTKMRSREESLASCLSARAPYAMRIRILLGAQEARQRYLRQRQEEELWVVHKRMSRIHTKQFHV